MKHATKYRFVLAPLLFMISNHLFDYGIFDLLVNVNAQGATTAVTATITDPNGLPYSNATINVQLVPVPAGPAICAGAGQVQNPLPFTSDPTGFFTINLCPNASISTPGTQWKFSVSVPGVPLPLGTGPQNCTATVTIAGASQDVSSSFSCPALSHVTAPFSATSIPNIINPTLPPYNAPLTQSCANLNVTLTNGSNVVACSTANFTAADIGKVIFASCCGGIGGQAKASSVLVLPQGVIHDIISSTSVHVCTTTGTCTPVNASANSANGTLLYWGFKADAAVQAAIAAVYAGPGPCEEFFWSGILMVSKGVGNGPVGCIQPIGALGDTNLSIEGTGRANSILLMTPDFDFTTGAGNSCGGGPTQKVCFFAVQGVERKYFGINGGGRSNTGTNNVIIMDALIDDYDWDVGLSDIGAQDTAMICYQMDGPGAYPQFVEVDGCGNIPILVNSGQWNTLVAGYAADVKGTNGPTQAGGMQVANGAVVTTFGFYFGACNSGGALNCVNVNSGGTWNSNGDFCLTGAGTNCLNNSGGVVHLHNFSICSTAASPCNPNFIPDHGIFSGNANAKTYITQSNINGTVNPILRSNGTIFTDDATTYGGGGTNSGLAPTCSATGIGASGTCTMAAGNVRNESGGVLLNVAGAGPASSGQVTLTFAGGGFTTNNVNPWSNCIWNLNNGTPWNARATVISGSPTSVAAAIVNWDNNGVALVAGNTYNLNYICRPN